MAIDSEPWDIWFLFCLLFYVADSVIGYLLLLLCGPCAIRGMPQSCDGGCFIFTFWVPGVCSVCNMLPLCPECHLCAAQHMAIRCSIVLLPH